MNLKKITQIIVNPDIENELKKRFILQCLAQDDNVIFGILFILNEERKQKTNLINDFNVELSRAIIVLGDPQTKFNKKALLDRTWVTQEIRNFYLKWKDNIKTTFKFKDLL